MIRRATVDDIDEVVEWGRKFYEYSPWSRRTDLNEADFKETLNGMFLNGTGAVFLNGTGFCGGVLTPLYFNYSLIAGVELFWFADEGGDELRAAFEVWAKENGASVVQMSCIADGKEKQTRRLFRMKGYEATEVGLLKEI